MGARVGRRGDGVNFESLAAFVSMGGHGAYVWTVYLAALALLIGNFAKLRRDRRRIMRQLRAQHAAAATQAAAPADQNG